MGRLPIRIRSLAYGGRTFHQKLNIFSDLKLRIGYGLAGNNRIGDFMSLETLDSVKYPNGSDIITGYVPSGIPSIDLQWEANKTLNIGLDMGFLAQRLIVTPEFYLNRSDHLLLNSRVPSSSGFTNMIRNVGETQNIGFDLAISSFNIQRKSFHGKRISTSHITRTRFARSRVKTILRRVRFRLATEDSQD